MELTKENFNTALEQYLQEVGSAEGSYRWGNTISPNEAMDLKPYVNYLATRPLEEVKEHVEAMLNFDDVCAEQLAESIVFDLQQVNYPDVDQVEDILYA